MRQEGDQQRKGGHKCTFPVAKSIKFAPGKVHFETKGTKKHPQKNWRASCPVFRHHLRSDQRSPGTLCSLKWVSRLDGVHIMLGCFQTTCAPLRREAHFGFVPWRLPAPLGRLPGHQRHPKGTPRTRFGSSGLSLGGPRPPLGSLPAPKGTPKSLQGRGQYEASDPKLRQTKASTLELHNTLPQGLWS